MEKDFIVIKSAVLPNIYPLGWVDKRYTQNRPIKIGFHTEDFETSEKLKTIADTWEDNRLIQSIIYDKYRIMLPMKEHDGLELLKHAQDVQLEVTRSTTTTTNTPYNYGCLYNWYTINTGKLAPIGYRIASGDIDYHEIDEYYSSTDVALKVNNTRTSPTVHPRWDSPNSATNISSLSVLGTGYRAASGVFSGIGTICPFWSGDIIAGVNGQMHFVDRTSFYPDPLGKKCGAPVRFVRDASVAEQLLTDGTIVEYAQDSDGNYYPMIKIGILIWSQQNLKTTKYNDGTDIPNVTDNSAWAALTTDAYCTYNNAPLSTYEDATYYYSVTTTTVRQLYNHWAKIISINKTYVEGSLDAFLEVIYYDKNKLNYKDYLQPVANFYRSDTLLARYEATQLVKLKIGVTIGGINIPYNIYSLITPLYTTADAVLKQEEVNGIKYLTRKVIKEGFKCRFYLNLQEFSLLQERLFDPTLSLSFGEIRLYIPNVTSYVAIEDIELQAQKIDGAVDLYQVDFNLFTAISERNPYA